MKLRPALERIDEANDEVIGDREGYEDQRDAYEKAIRAVHEIAGDEEAAVLVTWIEDQIREDERRPTSKEVRRRGAKICRHNDYEVPDGSWLSV